MTREEKAQRQLSTFCQVAKQKKRDDRDAIKRARLTRLILIFSSNQQVVRDIIFHVIVTLRAESFR